MATSYRNGTGPLNLTDKQNMLLDVAALSFVPIMVSFLFGVMNLEITIFGGYDLTQPLWGWTLGGVEISVALMIVVVGTLWIVLSNELDGSDYESWEFAIIAFALFAPILYVFVPAFASLVEMNDISRLFWFLAVSVASVYVSYTE
jgi:hypothetical protein